MARDRKKEAPVKSARSHYQKALFWGVLGLVTTFYTTVVGDGFSKLSFLQVVFFISSAKSLAKGYESSNKAKPAPAQTPGRAAIPKRIAVPRSRPRFRPRSRPRSTPQSTPHSTPHLATNQVEAPGRRWRSTARRNWYWVVLFLALWQVFERI